MRQRGGALPGSSFSRQANPLPTNCTSATGLQVVYDSEAVPSPALLVDALKSGGYEGALRRAGPAAGAKLASLRVEGMSCAACAASVEGALVAVPGVRSAAVSVVLGEARVEYDPALATEVCFTAAAAATSPGC